MFRLRVDSRPRDSVLLVLELVFEQGTLLRLSLPLITIHTHQYTRHTAVAKLAKLSCEHITISCSDFQSDGCRGAKPRALNQCSGLTCGCSCAIVLYLQMALSIVSIISATRRSPHSENPVSRLTMSHLVFAALRVFALFGRSRTLFALVFLTGFLNPAILIVSQSSCLMPRWLISEYGLCQYIFTRSIPAPVSAIQGCSLSIAGDPISYEKCVTHSLVGCARPVLIASIRDSCKVSLSLCSGLPLI